MARGNGQTHELLPVAFGVLRESSTSCFQSPNVCSTAATADAESHKLLVIVLVRDGMQVMENHVPLG